MFRIEHDTASGEIKEIELTAEEIAAVKADKAEDTGAVKVVELSADKAALLAKLGITADEFKTLLGGN